MNIDATIAAGTDAGVAGTRQAGTEAAVGGAVDDLVARLEAAWNAGDGVAFAEAFWEDADFTVFDGWHMRGRGAIAQDHVWAFTEGPRTGSTARFTVTSLRAFGDVAAVAHLLAVVDGTGRDGRPNRVVAVPRAVVERRGERWAIATYVNVLHEPIPPAHHPDVRALPQPVPAAVQEAAHGEARP